MNRVNDKRDGENFKSAERAGRMVGGFPQLKEKIVAALKQHNITNPVEITIEPAELIKKNGRHRNDAKTYVKLPYHSQKRTTSGTVITLQFAGLVPQDAWHNLTLEWLSNLAGERGKVDIGIEESDNIRNLHATLCIGKTPKDLAAALEGTRNNDAASFRARLQQSNNPTGAGAARQ